MPNPPTIRLYRRTVTGFSPEPLGGAFSDCAEVDDDTRARVRAKLDAIESQGVTARNEVSRAVRC